MKKVLSTLLCVLLLFLAAASPAEDSAADTVLYGTVITMDEDNPRAEAVAVRDGVIVFVGSREDAAAYIGAGTAVLDYTGDYIYPGFVDGHSHIGLFAMIESNAAELSLTVSLRENAETMKQYIADHPGREVYKGYNFWYFSEDPDALTHEVLDKYASDEVPIVWSDGGGHSALLNQKAIEYFHIKDWVEIYGTDGVRVDENGEPTGYLVETPRFDLMEMIPIEKEELKEYILARQEVYLAEGYTAMTDAGIVETDALPILSAYRELAEEGLLKLRVRALMEISDLEKEPLREVERVAALAKEFSNDYFQVTGIKVFIDGVPEALTAWTGEPYTVEAGRGDSYYGYIRWDDSRKEEMTEIIRLANENGLLVQAHVMGEAAVHYIIDCMESAREGLPDQNFHNALAHVSMIEPEDIPRLKENNIAVFLAPHWSSWKVGTKENETLIYGEEKAKRMYPVRSFLDAGILTSFHTDGMCAGGVPEMIFTAVTRLSPEILSINEYYAATPGSPDPLPVEIRGENEKVSAMDALKCLTVSAACTMKEEDRLGRVREGMLADLTVYSLDFTDEETVSSFDCTKAELRCVLSGGKTVYSGSGD